MAPEVMAEARRRSLSEEDIEAIRIASEYAKVPFDAYLDTYLDMLKLAEKNHKGMITGAPYGGISDKEKISQLLNEIAIVYCVKGKEEGGNIVSGALMAVLGEEGNMLDWYKHMGAEDREIVLKFRKRIKKVEKPMVISRANKKILNAFEEEIEKQKEFLSLPGVRDVDTYLILSIIIAEQTGIHVKNQISSFCYQIKKGGMNVHSNLKGPGGYGIAQVSDTTYTELIKNEEYRKFFMVDERTVSFMGEEPDTIAGDYRWNIRAMLVLMDDNYRAQYLGKEKIKSSLPPSQIKLYLAALHNMGAGEKGVTGYVLSNPTNWMEDIPKVHKDFLRKVERIYKGLTGKSLILEEAG